MTDQRTDAVVTVHDLALAIMAGAIGLTPPPGTSAEEAMRRAGQHEPEAVAGFYRAARNVLGLLKGGGSNVRH